MASFESGDRSEPATPRKRQEARERGQVARSQDLATALVLLAACISLHFFGLPSLQKMRLLVERSFAELAPARFGTDAVVHAAGACGLFCLQVLLPIMVLVMAVAVAGNLLQVGFLISGHPVSPDLARLSPVKGFQRLFSLRGLVRGGFGTIKIAIIGGVLCYTLWSELAGPQARGSVILLSGGIAQAVLYVLELAVEMALKAVLVILALAILDYAVQRWLHEQDLRMTKAELKEELRRMEGDPRIKERRRRVQEQLRYQRMMRDVPKANVVVTNPTHVAVAIRYERGDMAAPKVVAKGEGYIAQRIREVAMENGVAVVQRPELARGLYQAVEVGQEIPPEFYQAVAELLAYVYRLAGGEAAGVPAEGPPAGGAPRTGQPVGAGGRR